MPAHKIISDRQYRYEQKEKKNKNKEIKKIKEELKQVKRKLALANMKLQLLVSAVRKIKHGGITPWDPTNIHAAIRMAKQYQHPQMADKWSDSEYETSDDENGNDANELAEAILNTVS